MDTNQNRFLQKATFVLREKYPLDIGGQYLVRNETIASYPFTEVWFRTRGCKHDYAGGCTMCNYGRRAPESSENMVSYVRQALTEVKEDPNRLLLVSPSGSMFDEWEVPREARLGIYELVKELSWLNFSIETRVDTINESLVKEFSEHFQGRALSIEVGIESANPWIARYCVNKNLNREDLLKKIKLLKNYTISSIANICLGTAFLNQREAITDAVNSARWALDEEIDYVVIFPIHVKRGTLLEWLWKQGLYSPPSLWSLVQTLIDLGPTLSPRVSISWFKAYYQEVEVVNKKFLDSPNTCPICSDRVTILLEEYQAYRKYDVVQKLSQIECSCKSNWEENNLENDISSLLQRVASIYDQIGNDLVPDDWWKQNKESVITELESDADGQENPVLWLQEKVINPMCEYS